MTGAGAAAGGVVLRTERIVLRRFTPADVDALAELDADPEVMRWLSGGVPTPRADVERALATWLGWYDEDEVCARWAAEVDGGFAGWFTLRGGTFPPPPPLPGSPEPSRVGPELGYRLRRAVWGRGLATEGSRALLDRAFDGGAERVWAQTMTVNAGSRRVMEKLGMRLVRTFHLAWGDAIPGSEHGEVEYELTRDEWRRESIT